MLITEKLIKQTKDALKELDGEIQAQEKRIHIMEQKLNREQEVLGGLWVKRLDLCDLLSAPKRENSKNKRKK